MKTFEEIIQETRTLISAYNEGHPRLKSGGNKLQAMLKLIEEIVRVFRAVEKDKNWTPQRFAIVASQQQEEIKELKKKLKDCIKNKEKGDSGLFGGDSKSDEDGHQDNEQTDEPTPDKPKEDIFRKPLQ